MTNLGEIDILCSPLVVYSPSNKATIQGSRDRQPFEDSYRTSLLSSEHERGPLLLFKSCGPVLQSVVTGHRMLYCSAAATA